MPLRDRGRYRRREILAASLAAPLLGLGRTAAAARDDQSRRRPLCILPIFNDAMRAGSKAFPDDALQAEMTRLKQQIGQNVGGDGGVRVGFSHIFGGADALDHHCRLAQANNLSVGVIVGIQTHTGALGKEVLTDFRAMQWRLDGKTWEGEAKVGKNGNPEFPSRDWHLPTPSRYCALIHDAAMRQVRAQAQAIKKAMDRYPGVIVVVNATIEEELATGGEKSDDLLADYSPFAVAEFRDWLRHTGKYDDTTGEYPGEGAPEAIVGPFVRINGALRSPFYDDPTPDDAGGMGPSFNARFGTHFTTWSLRSWDPDRFPNPITDKIFGPTPASGQPGSTAGGFDAPRRRDPADPFWRAWSWDVYDQNGQYPPGNPDNPAFGFRQAEVAHFVRDVLGECRKAGIPADLLYAHQIPGEVISPGRCRSGASPIWTGYYPPGKTLGITRFGPIDPKRLSQYSADWGIFEWHPKPNAAPNDPALYKATLDALNAYVPSGGRIFYPGWWRANGKHEPIFPLNDSQFARALHDWLAARQAAAAAAKR